MAEKNEKEKAVNEQIRDFGQVELEHGEDRISMLTIIGEIEGHECLPAATKTTKYEHVLPKLAEVEENKNVDGLLLLLNTVGGDVESGLAIAEMVASISQRFHWYSVAAIPSACRWQSPRTILLSCHPVRW